MSHTTADDPAFAQLHLLAESGVSPRAWVWTHAQKGSQEAQVEAAQLGAWISIDNVAKDDLETTIELIINLKLAGLLNRLLISHDAGWFDPSDIKGGSFVGYTAIFTHLLPALKARGFTQKEIDQILIENPRQAYKNRVRAESDFDIAVRNK